MEVKTFRAATMQEALQLVRDALGPDASVLHTRELRTSRLGVFPRRLVEVEARRDEPQEPPARPAAVSLPLAEDGPASGELSQGMVPPAKTVSPGQLPATSASLAMSRTPTAPRQPEHPREAQQATRRRDAGLPPPAGQPRHTVAHPSAADDRPATANTPKLTAAMCEVLSEMLDAGLQPTDARELLERACGRLDAQAQHDVWLLQGQISQMIAAELHVSGPLELQPDEQKVVAFVGPTGVGKTTTLAKIAAGFRFDLGCQVGLITLDTFRLGAVDQLLQYAELISAPLEVVSSADQVSGALQRLRECDLVLLDTAGRSPKDGEQLAILAEFLRVAEPDVTHLVLSASSSQGHARESLRQFSSLKPSSLLLTKLDEAVGFGEWYSLLRETRLPVSYMTAGQQVPQDLAVASTRRLASMLLGHSPVFASNPPSASRMG